MRNLNFDLFCPSVSCLSFIVFVVDSFTDTFLSLAEVCLSVSRSSPTDLACCMVFLYPGFWVCCL